MLTSLILLWVLVILYHIRLHVVTKASYRLLEEADLYTLDLVEDDIDQEWEYVYSAIKWHTFSKKFWDWRRWDWDLDEIIDEYNRDHLIREVDKICK